MPKRKSSEVNYDDLCKKLKTIEDELLRRKRETRRRRVRTLSSSSSSPNVSPARRSNTEDCPPPQPASATTTGLANQAAPVTADAAPTSVQESALSRSDCEPQPVLEEENDVTLELDADVLDILGVDPSKTVKFGKDIQKDVAVRFEYTATTGLSKEERKDIKDKHLVPGNCKLIGAPALNPEVKSGLSEMVIKRDKVIESKQAILASAISSLSEAITLLLGSKEKNTELLRLLMDTGRAMCDCQHNDTLTRRNFIINSARKEMKESLQNAKIDNFLFGSNLLETLKTAKAINKTGADLIANSVPKPSTSKKSAPTTSKNWKISNFVRKQPVTSKQKDSTTTPPAPKSHRASFSKQSQSQRRTRSHR